MQFIDYVNECAERMVNASDSCAGHGRNGEGPPSIFQTSSQDRFWLDSGLTATPDLRPL